MKISMIVFDMAGTTIDEDNIVYKTLHNSINHYGYNVSLENVLEIGAGKEKLNAINDILNNHTVNYDNFIGNEIFNHFINNLSNAYKVNDIKPMQDAEEVLFKLRSNNIFVVLNTGYDRSTATFILDKIGWKQLYHYDLLVTASDVSSSRPDPEMINYAKNLLSINDSNLVIKVGDSKIDIEEGKNANCLYSIGITTGAQSSAQLNEANPDFIIHSLKDLFKILKLD